MKSRIGHFKEKFLKLSLDIVIPIFGLSFVLEMAHFFPDLRQINIWDEASYVFYGYQLLTSGQWVNLANSPLSSVLYALTILPVIHSPDFFVLSIAISRVILFTLIFWSVYLIARELKPYANPWVMVGLIFIVPVSTTMFLFPSDVLFAGLSGLAFWQMLAFYNHRDRKRLWWASGFMGLAMLARAEGLLLIGVMLVVTLYIVLPKRAWWQDVVALLIPFTVLVGGFVVFYGLTTGHFETGLADRTFYNFESGHEVIYSQTGIFTPTVSARLESRTAFGGPEENNYSVFRAIARNPEVYFTRLRHYVPSFLRYATKAYGNKFILIFLWLSIRGLTSLIKEKHYPLALMSALWFIPLGVSVRNTFIREGYFMMPFFVVFTLTSIGLTAMLKNVDRKSERVGFIAGSILVILVSVLARNTSMLYRSALFIFGLAFAYWVGRNINDRGRWQTQSLWLILVIVLIMRGGYPSPELPSYGGSHLEKSVYFLQDHFPIDSKVLAGAPANIWAARMTYYGINSYAIPEFADEKEFLVWVQVQGIDAVYVDQHFPDYFNTFVLALSGQGLDEVFATPARDIVIYEVSEHEL